MATCKSKAYPIFVILLIISITAQGKEADTQLKWSSSYKLTINDFELKRPSYGNFAAYGQFSMDFKVHFGIFYLFEDLNKAVGNTMIRSASWIDTTSAPIESLNYIQTLFDMNEIYARHFRKSLKDYKWNIFWVGGMKKVGEINNEVQTDFAKRKMDYESETNFGRITLKQKEWQATIQKELDELSRYSAE